LAFSFAQKSVIPALRRPLGLRGRRIHYGDDVVRIWPEAALMSVNFRFRGRISAPSR